MSDVQTTLAEREKNYGSFSENARVIQNIKRAMMDSPNWSKLTDVQRESLEMDATKTGRILNGDHNHYDSWHDKAGYSQLVADSLKKEGTNG